MAAELIGNLLKHLILQISLTMRKTLVEVNFDRFCAGLQLLQRFLRRYNSEI